MQKIYANVHELPEHAFDKKRSPKVYVNAEGVGWGGG